MTDSMKNHWESSAEELDSIYTEKKSLFRKAIDGIFRRSMRERVKLTFEECGDVCGKKILDIGCGSGRVAVELARRGAYVVGIDFSRNMIKLANSLAKKYDLQGECKFICNDFMMHDFNEGFHVSVALGVFDYTKDPTPYFEKIRKLTKEKCIMSFPSKFAFQTPIRKMWLKHRRVPVYFYTPKEIKKLLSPLFSRLQIRKIGPGFFCVANVSDSQKELYNASIFGKIRSVSFTKTSPRRAS